MRNLKLKQTLQMMHIDAMDYAVEQVIKKLREFTPVDETSLAKVIFKIHLSVKSENKRVVMILDTFERYATKFNATKVLDEIKKQRENLNINER